VSADHPLSRVAAPLRHEVVERLRDLVLSGEVGPGDRLLEKSLCERLDVSRTVIREALRQLEAERLIVTANRGPIVAGIDPVEAADLFDVRGVLEGLAGRLFAERATPGERKALMRRFREVKNPPSGDLNRLLVAKDRFYDALLDGAHNDLLRSALRSLHDRIRGLRRISLESEDRIAATGRELQAIIDATVINPDPVAAWVACEAHARGAGEVVLARLHQKLRDDVAT
jgi:DNA-binding GntR family transcriptional regulator